MATAESGGAVAAAYQPVVIPLVFDFDFDFVQHTSTFLAHQLLHHAKAASRQLPMLDVLFSAFFERGRDLRRVEELGELALEVGLDAAEVRVTLETGRYRHAVQ